MGKVIVFVLTAGQPLSFLVSPLSSAYLNPLLEASLAAMVMMDVTPRGKMTMFLSFLALLGSCNPPFQPQVDVREWFSSKQLGLNVDDQNLGSLFSPPLQ